jgi:hypothetical protein
MSRARESFSFLEDEWATTAEIDDQHWYTIFRYTSPELIIEVTLDWREQFALVGLRRPVEGGRPSGYYVHEGRRIRTYLGLALRTGDERDRATAARLRDVAGKTGFPAMLEQISLSSSILRDSLPGLLSRIDEIFEFPPMADPPPSPAGPDVPRRS